MQIAMKTEGMDGRFLARYFWRWLPLPVALPADGTLYELYLLRAR